MAVLLTPPYLEFADNDGNPLSGGKIYTYAAGTVSTPKATFTTAAGNINHTNPAVLDSAGRIVIFGEGSYKFVITDSNDNIIRTIDNVTTFTTLSSSSDPFFQSFSGNATQTVFTLTEDLGTEEKAIMVFVDNSGRDYVTNGQFTSDTGWTKGSGWSIAAGVASATTASTALSQTAPFTLTEGIAYVITYTVTRAAGDVTPSIGGTSGTTRSSAGTYTEQIIAGATQIIAFTGATFTGTIDSVTIKVANSAGFQFQNPNLYVLDGTSLTFTTAPASGTNNIMVTAPSLLVGAASAAAAAAAASEAGAQTAQAAAELAETNAETAETNAETAATQAQNYAASYSGTSTTSLSIGTGTKVFTTQSGKLWVEGQFLQIASDASAVNYMNGTVTSYSGTTLTMNIIKVGGSGTFADWNISISGAVGATGAAGGPVSDGDYGDIIVTSSGSVWSLDTTAVTPSSYTNASITVDSKGRLTAASSGQSGDGPKFMAKGTSTQSIPSTTYTKMQLNTEVFDTDNCYDNVTNYRFTANKAGKYFFYTKARLQSLSGGSDNAAIALYKNGSQEFLNGQGVAATIGGDYYIFTSGIFDMNGSTDYVEAYVYHSNASSKNLDKGDSAFFGFYVGV